MSAQMKPGDERGEKIAYLTTQYPAVSHSFIRREILALEKDGYEIGRFSVRPPAADLPDPVDQSEAGRTTVILSQGLIRLAGALLALLFMRPMAFVSGLRCAYAMHHKAGAGAIRHLAYVVEAAWLARRLRQEGYTHLHVHFGTNPTAVARIARHFGGPSYSFTVHGPDEFDNPAGLDLQGKIADARLCAGISSFGKSQLLRWAAYRDWPRVAVARCGIDEQFASDAGLTPVPDTSRLCCVARLSRQKGLPLLLDAAAELRRRGTEFHLTLVGDGEMRGDIERQIREQDLASHVTITGWASGAQVRAHLEASRAMILPSFAEGLPVVIMEALALERPVVATAIAGVPELVDSVCGALIPAGDIGALADAMERILDTPVEVLRAMGAEGRRRVLARHDAFANARALVEAIRQIAPGARS